MGVEMYGGSITFRSSDVTCAKCAKSVHIHDAVSLPNLNEDGAISLCMTCYKVVHEWVRAFVGPQQPMANGDVWSERWTLADGDEWIATTGGHRPKKTDDQLQETLARLRQRRDESASVPGGHLVDDPTCRAATTSKLPMLCPKCDHQVGETDGEQFYPHDSSYIQAEACQMNGTWRYSIKCRCGKEWDWGKQLT